MLIDRLRKALLQALLPLLCLLPACGGGGGSSGVIVFPSASGSLAITVSNLPAGLDAAIVVTGPGNYSMTVKRTATLAGLAPGSYTISAGAVAAGAASYTPSPASQQVTVSEGAASTAAVSYTTVGVALGFTQVASGIDGAAMLDAPPGDGRLFIVERGGRIRIWQNGVLLAQPFLDISASVAMVGEGGLLSMAFDPQFATNGYVYVYFTDAGNNIVIARFSRSSNANVADAASRLDIIRIPHPDYVNHFGGLVAFGPDGYLYAGTGDGGGEGDPAGNGQNRDVLLGKLLRLDVSGARAGAPYAVPPTNPFAGGGGRPEIWAYGLRNPWRYAFDGGRLYIADVGQDRREEIDVVAVGGGGFNFAWNLTEGTLCYKATSCVQNGITPPAFEYDHGENDVNGCAITGGYVYRGKAIPEVAGQYFYSDYCAGFLHSIDSAGTMSNWTVAKPGTILSFGRDGDGELYVITSAGSVFKMVRTISPKT